MTDMRYPLDQICDICDEITPLQCEVLDCPNMATHTVSGWRGHRHLLCPIHLAEYTKRQKHNHE